MGEVRTSPMLDQYRRIKRDHQGNVLFFRLGDFYEMFAEDAVEISALLNLTLTSRNGLPMCGIPYHAARTYIARLLKHGKKIAICEQLSEPGKGSKIIDRQVVEVITPGTTVDEDYLDRESSNYLVSLAATANAPESGGFVSFSYIDLSAGSFYATSFPLANSAERLRQELERLQAKEMLVQESLLEENETIARALAERSSLVLNRWADWLFDREKAAQRLKRQFGISSLKSFGLEDESPELLSAGAILDYLDDTAKSLIPHIRSITVYQDSEFVGIDESSQRNLELVRNLLDGDVRFSLLEVIDETRCSMGKRLLKWRLLHPLRDIDRIRARLSIVETLYRDQGSLNTLRELLGKTPDLERLCSRLAMDKAHGKDMLAVKNALINGEAIRKLRESLHIVCESDTAMADDGFARLMELKDLLERSIADDPSILLTEGNLIRDGYNADLDALHKLRDSGRQLLEEYLEEEKTATGISSLKIRYNRLIGYFFEVTKTHLDKIPQHFIRRQGIVGGERFSTERLAALESDINGASDKIIELERRLFIEIREKAKLVLSELAAEARRVAEIDAGQSLARAASIRGWVCPVVDNSNSLEIYEARHPVVEAHLGRGEFIPNDILLNNGDHSPYFAMITGPNMAGKSTYLRSAALITLMAQMGSFIPAREGRIGLCDRIYCRVGASDNLARGESTFLVEMNETAYILNTATEKSLVIMDEVGRGTGTNDGLSIAWAVSEELLERIKCRTFFATHYHELSLLQHPCLANRSMEVLEKNGAVVFLRRLKEGPAAGSYGLYVARLAGLSPAVLSRAAQLMERLLERDANLRETLPSANVPADETSDVNHAEKQVNNLGGRVPPGSLVNHEKNTVNKKVLNAILRLDPEKTTPLEALTLINQWKRQLAAELEGLPPAGTQPRGKVTDTSPSLFD